MREWLEEAAGVFTANALLNYIWELCMSVSGLVCRCACLPDLFGLLPGSES